VVLLVVEVALTCVVLVAVALAVWVDVGVPV
jgi:hypothetical protein